LREYIYESDLIGRVEIPGPDGKSYAAEVRGRRFAESVVELFEGRLGQPPGGCPKALQQPVLRGRKPQRGRPGASLPPADFAATRKQLDKQLGRPATDREVVTHLLYPRVFADFVAHQQQYSDTSVLPTPVFFF